LWQDTSKMVVGGWWLVAGGWWREKTPLLPPPATSHQPPRKREQALHGTSPEVGLLERQRFGIAPRPARELETTVYDIFDPRTHEPLGVIRQQAGWLRNFLGRFLSQRFLTTKLEVRETEDESLVFTVRRTMGWWRQRIDVYDADDHWMGSGEQGGMYGRGGFWIFDARNLPLAEIRGALPAEGCRFQAPDGRLLCMVTREGTEPGWPVSAGANPYVVSIDETLAKQPLAKMLLLGTA